MPQQQPMNKMMTIRQPNNIPIRGCLQIQQPIGMPRMPMTVNRMTRPPVTGQQFINAPPTGGASGGMIQQQITMSSQVNLPPRYGNPNMFDQSGNPVQVQVSQAPQQQPVVTTKNCSNFGVMPLVFISVGVTSFFGFSRMA